MFRHFLLFSVVIISFEYAYSINCKSEKDAGVNCDNTPVTLKFYFDTRTNVCQPLFYRGCGGNENRFNTREECSNACVPQRAKKPSKAAEEDDDDDEDSDEESSSNKGKDMSLVVNMCKIRTDAKISEKAKKCDDGCPIGWQCNKKNFCCPMKDHLCSMPVSSGTEREAFKHYGRYAYQPGLKNCIRFSYFGLEGNYNNFLSYKDCKKYCVKTDEE